mmetsp:Transcript_123688/g.242686  ORF Transcript_123688/g.242686 Transcript_123688/m.242686 type:complete len:82 (+) Transcript_123688:261-506(+)
MAADETMHNKAAVIKPILATSPVHREAPMSTAAAKPSSAAISPRKQRSEKTTTLLRRKKKTRSIGTMDIAGRGPSRRRGET